MSGLPDRLRHAADLARAISSGLEVGHVLEQVTRALEALRPELFIAVRLVDQAAGGYRLAAAGGAAIGSALDVIDFGAGLTHVVADTREPVLVDDVPSDAGALPVPRFSVYYGVPIAAGDALLGVVDLGFPAGAAPSAEEREIIGLLAAQAAVAMRNATLYAKSESRRRAAEGLAEVGRLLSRTLDPDLIARQIADHLLRFLDARVAAIHRCEADSGDLVMVALAGAEGPLVPGLTRFTRGTGIVGLAARDRRPVTSLNVLHDPRITLDPETRALVEQVPFRSGLAVPLIVQEHLIGVLAVGDRPGRVWDTDDIALAQTFADQAAVALENARLFALERRHREQTQALAEIERELVSELKSDRLLRLIVERAGALFDAVGGIYLLEGERLLVPRAWTGAATLSDVNIPVGVGIVGLSAAARRGVVVDDYASWPRAVPQFVALGLRRAMACPLIARDRLLGVITVNRRGEGTPPFRGDDLAILDRCATLAAIALQNATLYEEAERRRREAEALAQVARTLTESLDVAAVGTRIVDSVIGLFDAQSSGLRLLQDDGTLVMLAVGGRAREQFAPGHVMAEGDSISGRAVREGHAVWSANIFSDPRVTVSEDLRQGMEAVGDAALLGVPLHVQDRIVGALSISDRPGREYTEAEAALLQGFADQAALALENARLYERLEERAQKLTALSELTRLITSAQDFPRVVDAVARAATLLLGARTSRVWIDDPAAGGVRVTGGFGSDPGVERPMTEVTFIAYGKGVVGRIMATRQSEYLANIAMDPRWLNWQVASEGGLCGFAGLPLIAGDRVLGVLSLMFAEERDFTPEDRELMGFLADQAAIALSNARLYEGEQLRAGRLRTLVNITRMVSASLDTGEVLRDIARSAAELMSVPLVAIWTADENARTLEVRAFSDETLGASFPVRRQGYDEGSPGWVATHRADLDAPDIAADGRIAAREWFREHGIKSAYAAPIEFSGGLLGVIGLFGRAPVELGADAREPLPAFVAQAAVALRNARLYEALLLAHERLEQSQAQLVRAERLGALGEMAAGVAHDFNNLLAVILGRTELLLRRIDDQPLRNSVDAIRQAARDGADTVRRIQEFTRTRTTRSFARVEPGVVLREVVELTRPRWKDEAQSRGIQYDVVVTGEAPPVAGRPEELREVFANLLANALDAMPEGGRCQMLLTSTLETVEVAVSDTGGGMTDEVRQRVFEPFFTTKGHRGNGLGLSVAWGIVARHGGTIDVASRPGAGTTFTVRLPVGRRFTPEVGRDAPPRRATRSRILVVDDEPAVRTVLAAVLAEHGHEVVEAGNGPEGLARCAEERFDVVISDLSMPAMSGWEFAAACRERFPNLPVGLITGWGDRLDPALIERHRVRFVIAKPFEGEDIIRQLAQVLP
jgi:GAF domain-containing protein